MAERISDFPQISFPVPEKEIFFRLGGHAGKKGMSESFSEEYKSLIHKAFALCTPCGRTRVLDIVDILPQGVLLSGGELLIGSQFAATLAGCRKLWCAAATVGKKLVEARDAQTSVSAKSIYDAVGSECAEKTIRFLHEKAVRDHFRRGELVSLKRYSPGYGDMPIETQKMFFNFLKLNDLGLSLTEENFIVPEKTVTAWAGITVLGENLQ